MWRSFDVAAVVAAFPSPDVTVAAGASGLGRAVSTTRVAATTEHLRDVEAGALVITATSTLAAVVGTAEHLVAHLDAAGVAALALCPDTGAGPPEGVIRAADHLGLPIITFASGTALADATSTIVDALLRAQGARLERAVEAHERFAAITLEELVSGHASDPAEISERAASFGWDLSLPRAVLLASVDPPTPPEVVRSALGTIAAAARATLGSQAIVWHRSTSIGALVAPDGDAPAARRILAERWRADLDARLQTVSVSIGVGRVVTGILELSRSFAEASRAVDVGRWVKGRHVTELFDSLGIERLLASVPQAELGAFVRVTVGALHDHDRAHGTELLDTLGVWLETRNAAEAARRMHVHYNTLKNRIDRIEGLLGPVTSDPARALECEVAIHIARHSPLVWDVDATS